LHSVRPPLQRLALFIYIRVAIVDGSNAGDDTSLVVQNGLDDMRLDAHDRHVGRSRASKIVETPIFGVEADEYVEPLLEPPKTGDRRLAGGREHEIGVEET